MSFSVQIGLLMAVATAFFAVVGFLYKHRGAAASPPIEWQRPVRTSLALFRNRWYVLGIVIAIGSWGFHVAALALAPISLVQSVIAGGLVLLTVVADRLFAHEVTRREWVGVALAALGLAFLAATIEGSAEGAHSDYEALTLTIFLAAVVRSRSGSPSSAGGAATPALPLAPPPASSGPPPTRRSRRRRGLSARASRPCSSARSCC